MASSTLASATARWSPARRRPALTIRLWRHPSARTGGLLLLAILGGILFAPVLTPYDPVRIAPDLRLAPPTLAHPLGNDLYGRDTLTRVLYGGRISLAVGGLSVGLALTVGGALGILAGYWGGWCDAIVMRISDVLLAFPAILLAIGLLAFLGGGFWNVVLAIGIIFAAPMARVARAAVLTVRHEEYVDAAGAVGAGDLRILRRHILPNAAAPLVVESTLRLALAILAEAALSFLGLGTQPPTPTWGQMIAEGRAVMTFTSWPAIGPGLAITMTVLGFNLLGDGIRDAMDPHAHRP
ncbi:MAG: ABC transporter permease [Armatimonadota bacterium]|nr:ABC transporter permease [Armatimonadota bacterium]